MAKQLLSSTASPVKFIFETMVWGLKETFDRKNWIVAQHDRQHGLDDARSEISYVASGVSEALFTGNYLAAVGRFLSLFPDVLHSVNLVRHSEGIDLLRNEPIKLNIPDFVSLRIHGETDVQDLKFETKESSVDPDTRQRYNLWLALNRSLNFKMFPNGAGRTAEMTTGLGLLVVGSLIANQQGVDTSTFDVIRGYMEAAIGAGSLAAGTVDVLVTEEGEGVEASEHDDFIRLNHKSNENFALSILKRIPRAIKSELAKMYNENTLLEKIADNEITSEEIDKDVFFTNLFEKASKREASKITGLFRSLVGDVVGDFKELSDHFGDVKNELKASATPLTTLFQDLKSSPARYAGAVQLASAQLIIPLAGFTSIAGVMSADTIPAKVGYAMAGMAMSVSWFFKHRGCAAKTRMSLRGITVNGNDLNPA